MPVSAIDRRLRRRPASPFRLIVSSFSLVILAGAGLLMLPIATPPDQRIGWVDALFTATSAACVTGLAVRDTGAGFTPFGQAVILALIQVGGLGVMTFTILFYVVGGRLSIGQRALMEHTLAGTGAMDPRGLLRAVVLFTLAAEAVGALALFLCFRETLGTGAALWSGVFHSVSAFCNAGFSLFATNLMGYRSSVPVNAIVAVLITLGGLGFLVVHDVGWRRRRFRQLSLHSRVVFLTSAVLTAGGAVALLAADWTGVLAGATATERVLVPLFQSVSARTAGFNTIDIGALTPASLLVLMLLMFVGGSPASCAGGIKTTSLVVILAALRARLTGRRHVNIFGRTVDVLVVESSFGVAAAASAAVVVVLLALLWIEGARGRFTFVDYAFEAVSAIGTVGLSTGVTPVLSPASKLLVCLLMFIGRIGPLTLAGVVTSGDRPDDWRHPTEGVMIG